MYATVQDMIDRFGEPEMIQLTGNGEAVEVAPVERVLADAQAMVDGYVGRIYTLPLVGCVKPAPTEDDPQATELVPPPQLTRVVCDVARYYLYNDLPSEHEVVVRFKSAERHLVAISKGEAVVSCPWGGEPGPLVSGGSTPGDGEASHCFAARQITDDTLRGFG